MQSTVHRLLAGLAIAGFLCLSGCLQFDAQEVHLYHDAEADRLDMMLVYRGLYSSKTDLKEAREDLAHAKASGMFAFWDNWPLKVDVVKTKPPAAPLLKSFVEVETGGLFTDPAGVLCGYQFVRIRKVSRFVRAVNQALALWVRTRLLTGKVGDGNLDEDTIDMIEDALRRPSFVTIADGCLSVRVPCSDAGHRWLLRHIGKEFADEMAREMLAREYRNIEKREAALAGEGTPPPDIDPDQVTIDYPSIRAMLPELASFRFWMENDFSVIREDGALTVRIGVPGRRHNEIHKPPAGGYLTNLLDDLRGQQAAIEVGVPDQELDRRFEEFRRRDVDLPPELATWLGRTPGK